MEPVFDSDGAAPRKNPYETGKFLVMFEDDAPTPQATLADLGLNVASASDFGAAGYEPPETAGYDVLYLDHLRVAVVEAREQPRMSQLAANPTVVIEPERYVFARADEVSDAAADFSAQFMRPSPFIQGGGGVGAYPFIQGGGGGVGAYPFIQGGGGVGAYPFIQGGGVGAYPFIQGGLGAYPFIQATPSVVTYLEGFRDAAQGLLARLGGAYLAPGIDESRATWGLQAIRATASRNSGLDLGVAVLDTGFDLEHPDFRDRDVTHRSFITGEDAQDVHGHGTHCIGTACGPLEPEYLPRYGVAYKAKIFAGKVLNKDGRGTDGEVLAGMNWAITSGCRVISMSLGTPTRRGEPFSRTFERVAQRALDRGTIVIAAAGNESRRDMNIFNPVSHPANCPSVLAVAAVDQNLRVAFFSNQGSATGGGQVDLSGPGVGIYSTVPMPARYDVFSGTSMATPHVAGVAALFTEVQPDATALEVKKLLQRTAMRIPGAAVDVGAGLVQAP